MKWRPSNRLGKLLDDLMGSSEDFVDGVAAVRSSRGWAWAGWSASGLAPGDESTFDLASLTKPCMATLAAELHRSGRLDVHTPLRTLWAECPASAPLLADLLRHRSGLRAWWPFYSGNETGSKAAARREAVLAVTADPSCWSSVGRVYSDVGYLLWGVLTERALGEPLESLWAASSRAGEPSWRPGLDHRASPIDTSQEVLLAAGLGLEIPSLPPPGAGEVQDGNARHLGRTGHAGLFGSARGVAEWLERTWIDVGGDLRRHHPFERLQRPETHGHWVRPDLSTSCGHAVSALAFGHTGFVGGALWVDPASDRAAVWLANRSEATRSIEGSRSALFTRLLAPGIRW